MGFHLAAIDRTILHVTPLLHEWPMRAFPDCTRSAAVLPGCTTRDSGMTNALPSAFGFVGTRSLRTVDSAREAA
jgi:hypothetical protein